jgi:hypothetical protein
MRLPWPDIEIGNFIRDFAGLDENRVLDWPKGFMDGSFVSTKRGED